MKFIKKIALIILIVVVIAYFSSGGTFSVSSLQANLKHAWKEVLSWIKQIIELFEGISSAAKGN